MFDIKNVIVLGLDGPTALAVIRSFKDEKFRVIGIEMNKHELKYTNKSKYLSKLIKYDKNLSDEELFNNIINEKSLKNSLIFPTSDKMVIFLCNYADKLIKNNIYCGYNKKLLYYINKDNMKQLVKESKLQIPKLYSFKNLLDNKVEYPIIAKSRTSINYTKYHYKIFYNKNEFSIWSKSKNKIEDFIFEEYIEGEAEDMYEAIGYINDKNNIYIPCMIQKIRQYPLKVGSSSYVKVVDNEYLKCELSKLLKNIDYSGLVHIEVKYNKKNKLFYFIEINFRPCLSLGICNKAGVNLSLCYYKDLIEDKFEKRECTTDVKWIYDFRDIEVVGNFLKYLAQFKKCDSYGILDLHDIKPFANFITGSFKLYFKYLFKG